MASSFLKCGVGHICAYAQGRLIPVTPVWSGNAAKRNTVYSTYI